MDMTLESCRKVVEVLASDAPAPGGGGAAALVGALGTALGNMVGSLTVGKKKYEEMAALGIEISAENPIYIDLPCWTANEGYANRANAYKQSVEAATAGRIIVNLTECATVQEWYDAGYYPSIGAEGNYDICDLSGWGPDYGDPQTYLDTMLPQYAGYMTKAIGVF